MRIQDLGDPRKSVASALSVFNYWHADPDSYRGGFLRIIADCGLRIYYQK